MISRGCSGEVRIRQELDMRRRDYLAGTAAFCPGLVQLAVCQDINRV